MFAGVVLNTGETIACRAVLSSQSRRNALLGCDEMPFEEARRLRRKPAANRLGSRHHPRWMRRQRLAVPRRKARFVTRGQAGDDHRGRDGVTRQTSSGGTRLRIDRVIFIGYDSGAAPRGIWFPCLVRPFANSRRMKDGLR